MRTHYCGAVSAADIGNTVTLCGWAHRRRDHGGVIFVEGEEGVGATFTLRLPGLRAAALAHSPAPEDAVVPPSAG